MPFLLLFCLMAVCRPIDWPESPLGLGAVGSITYTGAMVAALLLAAAALACYARLGLIKAPDRRERISHRYGLGRTAFFFANLVTFAFCLFALGWGDTAQRLGLITFRGRETFVPGVELLILAPFLAVQTGSWLFFYDAERAFHANLSDPRRRSPVAPQPASAPVAECSPVAPQPANAPVAEQPGYTLPQPGYYGRFWSRGGYLLFMFRQQFILFIPLVLMIGQQALERMYPEMMELSWMPLAAILLMPAFFILLPLFLPMFLGLRPLPRGPIRDRLEAHARRLHFRYAQIYVWETRGAVANAMVVGVIPWARYVVFTDRLLEELTDDETDAVFGHEVGHAYYGHMVYYALFLILSVLLLGALLQAIPIADETAIMRYRDLLVVAQVAMMGAYMFSAFGFISRRCERQADIFGCRAGSCSIHSCKGHTLETPLAGGGTGLCATGIDALVRALRRIEVINDMARETPIWQGAGLPGKLHWIFHLLTAWLHSWQHSTIPKRVAFLQSVAADPKIERRFQIRIWALKWLVMIGLVASLVALGIWKGWNVLLLTM